MFGYRNVDVRTPDGQAQPRPTGDQPRGGRGDPARAFALYAGGLGIKATALALNAEGVGAPNSRRTTQRGWAPSTVRDVLHRRLYLGEQIWGRRRKRYAWGQARRQAPRPDAEWTRHRDERLRIVPDALWGAAHDRLDGMRTVYLRHQDGRVWGRPAYGKESPSC